MTQVLILDGQQRSALAATRSLGRHGVLVHVADTQCATLAGTSRYARSQLIYPDPRTDAGQFTDWVFETASRLDIEMVLPLTDLSTMLLAPVRNRFGKIRIASGPAQSYELVSDKAKLIELARSAGVAAPATTILTNLGQLKTHLRHCNFPLVLKPARSKVLIGNEVVATNVHIAHSPDNAYSYAASQHWFGIVPCLAQEFIHGHGAGVFTLFAQGKPAAWFAHRRVREKPPSGGVSVLSESVELAQMLVESSRKLLQTANWNGLAMLEFKIADDGTAYLMEINGRPWGSLQLSIDCGVDFPWLLYQSMIGAQLDEPGPYRIGRRLRWLLGDTDNLLIQLKDGNLSPGSKLKALAQFMCTFADLSCRQETFRWSDPAPAFRELRTWLKALV